MPRAKREVPIERYTAMTYAEVAAVMGISAMRVCQIEKKALAKLRHLLDGREEEGRRPDWILSALRADVKSVGQWMRNSRRRDGLATEDA